MFKKKQYNSDLSKKVAQDSRRLVKGLISESDFHVKYHEAYLNEFGIDNRLLTSKSIFNNDVNRRTFLKVSGIAITSILGMHLLGRTVDASEAFHNDSYHDDQAATENEEQPDTDRVQMGMVIDLEKCDGCLSCVYACWNHNFNPPGVLWLHVLSFKDINKADGNFLLRICQHCANPPCVKVCPVRARHKREKDGLVLTDYNLCIGCRYCMVACPYGVNYFQWDTPTRENFYHEKLTDIRGRWVLGNPPRGVMGKCTFCPDRQDDGRANVVCELVCTKDVIHFGDMNDPDSRPNRYLEQRRTEKGNELTTFRLLEKQGTKPSIIYIGQQPSESSFLIEGPVSYSDWGLYEKRLPFIQGPEPWFNKVFGVK